MARKDDAAAAAAAREMSTSISSDNGVGGEALVIEGNDEGRGVAKKRRVPVCVPVS